MKMQEGMGRRLKKDPDEQDVFTGWRRYYLWTQRTGATSKVKRRSNRRVRRQVKNSLRDNPGDW